MRTTLTIKNKASHDLHKDADPFEKVKEFLKCNDLASIGEKVNKVKKATKKTVKLLQVPTSNRKDDG